MDGNSSTKPRWPDGRQTLTIFCIMQINLIRQNWLDSPTWQKILLRLITRHSAAATTFKYSQGSPVRQTDPFCLPPTYQLTMYMQLIFQPFSRSLCDQKPQERAILDLDTGRLFWTNISVTFKDHMAQITQCWGIPDHILYSASFYSSVNFYS